MRTVFFLDTTPEVYESIYWLNAGSTSASFVLVLLENKTTMNNSVRALLILLSSGQ